MMKGKTEEVMKEVGGKSDVLGLHQEGGGGWVGLKDSQKNFQGLQLIFGGWGLSSSKVSGGGWGSW